MNTQDSGIGNAGHSFAPAPGSAKITQRQLESILINEGIIQAAAIEDPDGYDGGKTKLAMTIATQQINALLSPNELS
jgi:hypothetical protein